MEDKTSKCTGECFDCPYLRWTTPQSFLEEPKLICTLFEEDGKEENNARSN